MRASVAAVPAALAALLVLAVYWPVLSLGFVWDDIPMYVDVPALRDGVSFWSGTLATVHRDLHYFRPLALLTFKAQFLLFGPSPVAGHAIALALHVANTFLVALLAARLCAGSGLRTALAGLLYGLHPALIEPVSWMSCRFDLLVTLWLLLALHTDLSLRSAGARAATLAGLYFAALNSKEAAAAFPAVLALFQLATRYADATWTERWRRGVRAELPAYLAMAAALVAYAALRARFVGGAVDTDPDVAAELTGAPERIAFVAATLLFHLRNVLLPFTTLGPLHPVDLDALAFTAADVPVLLAALAVLAVLAWGVVRGQRSLVLLAAGVIALVPVLNIVPSSIARNIGHERYLTFPLVLFVLAVAVVPWPAVASRGARAAAAVIALAWLAGSAVSIRSTVPLWQSDVSLWSWALARTDSDYARHSLVAALIRAGRPDLAELQLPPAPGNAYRAHTRVALANFLLTRGHGAAGEAQLRRALAEFPPWHRQPPAEGRDAREFRKFRGTVGAAYARLAGIERQQGDADGAREAASLAQFYRPPAVIP